jgi:hypothetical protein
MPGITLGPGFQTPEPPRPRILGTLIYTLRLQIGAAGAQVTASRPLPFPARIRTIAYVPNGANFASAATTMDIKLAADNDTSGGVDTTGQSIGRFVRDGTSPPDLPAESGLPFTSTSSATPITLDVNIPVPGPNHFLKLVSLATLPGTTQWMAWATIDLLSSSDGDPAENILPRGTEADPVCVRVCEPVLVSGFPPTGPPPPPTPQPPPPPTTPDPLADPLPPPCDIDPDAPLTFALQLCEVP